MHFKWLCIQQIIFLSFLTASRAIDAILDYQPQQIHISFGRKCFSLLFFTPSSLVFDIDFHIRRIAEDVNEIIVTWSTMDSVGDHKVIVEYGVNGFDNTASGTSEKFIDGGNLQHTQYIHRVRIPFASRVN